MLDTKTRASVAHILLALINADNVIDQGEIEHFAKIKKKYDILPKDLLASDTMSLAEALNNIVEYARKKNEDRFLWEFYNSAKNLTTSDGFCAQCEARIVYAMKSVFFGDKDNGVQVFACEESSIKIEGPKIFFVGEDSHTLFSKEFTDYFQEYYYEFLNYGFELINVSAIGKELIAMGKENIVDLLTIERPDLLRSRAAEIYDELKEMKPQSVFEEILGGNINVLNDGLTPYFLIKVCDSKVVSNGTSRTYYNFIRVPIVADTGVKKVIRNIVMQYSECATHLTPVILPADFHKFRYFSFTKSLFSFLEKEINKKDKCLKRLVIDAVDEKIYFEGLLNDPIEANYKEIALYILISWLSSKGVLLLSKTTKLYDYICENGKVKDKYRAINEYDQIAIDKYEYIRENIMGSWKEGADPCMSSQSLGKFKRKLRLALEKNGFENIEEYTRQYFPDTIEKTFSIGEKGEEDYTLTGYVLNIDYSKVYVRIKCNKPFKKGKGEEKIIMPITELQDR